MKSKHCLHETNHPYPCIYCRLQDIKCPEDKQIKIAHYFWQDNKKSYSGKGCGCCKEIDEPYCIKDKVWRKEAKMKKGFLCLKCLQNKINRKITLNDFDMNIPINQGTFMFCIRAYIKYEVIGKP